MKREDYNRKVETRGELLTHILDAAVCIKKCEYQLRQHATFEHELRSTLRLIVGFWNIYFEL